MTALRTILALALIAGYYLLALAIAAGLAFGSYVVWTESGDVRAFLLLIVAGVIAWSLVPARDEGRPPGIRLVLAQHPRLLEALGGVARAVGQELPRDAYLMLEPNAWVRESGGWLGLARRRQIALGLPLLQGLTPTQLRAVLAHEFGHFQGGDTRLGPFLYQARAAMERTVERLNRSALAMPFVWYARLFIRVTHGLLRRQERAADQLAARVVGSGPTALALRRVSAIGHAFGAFWQWEFSPALRARLWPPLIDGVDRYLRAMPVVEGMEAAVKQELAQTTAHPWDTHPPLAERLAALAGQRASQTEVAAEPMALSLLENHERLERQLLAWVSGDHADQWTRISWAELLDRVRFPSWLTHQHRFGSALAGLRTEALGSVAASQSALHKRLADQAGGVLTAPAMRSLAADTIGIALLLALQKRGWELDVQVGYGVILRHEQHELKPFALVHQLLATKGQGWDQERERLGIPSVPLDEKPDRPAPPPDPADVFPPLWWDVAFATGLRGMGAMYYGWGAREPLSPAETPSASAQGFLTESVRRVKWFTVALVPLVPLGTYRVVSHRQGWRSRNLVYLVQREDWDWSQVLRQYALVVALGGAGLLWWSRIPSEGSPAALDGECQRGIAEACHQLGQTNAPRDPTGAAGLYERACELGDGGACNDSGVALIHGEGVARDPERAVLRFEQGCDRGAALACYNLALALDSGRDIGADIQRALGFYQRSCGGGNSEACLSLGKIYDDPHGRPVARDAVQARALLGRACRAGEAEACRLLPAVKD